MRRGRDRRPAAHAAASLTRPFIRRRRYTPTAFRVGVGSEAENANKAGENEGACRVLAFAKLHSLSKREAVALFAQHAADVAADPNGTSHKNIRGLMAGGMTSLRFEPFSAQPLKPKATA